MAGVRGVFMSSYDYRPPCPKCKREVANYFDHTTIACKDMTDSQLEKAMLRVEYNRYCYRHYSVLSRVNPAIPLTSFNDWCRAMADNAKDEAKSVAE